jgi:hypothetical protein
MSLLWYFSEWVELSPGIVAQIMGHKSSAVAEKLYIQRELDLLHRWQIIKEAWYWGRLELNLCRGRQDCGRECYYMKG